MPYGPNGERSKKTPLTEAEQKQKLKDLQREQAETLREALGPELYDWLDDFEQDADVLSKD